MLTHMNTHVNICAHIHVAHLHTQCTCAYTCTHAHIHAHKHIFTHVHVCTPTHAHIHICTHVVGRNRGEIGNWEFFLWKNDLKAFPSFLNPKESSPHSPSDLSLGFHVPDRPEVRLLTDWQPGHLLSVPLSFLQLTSGRLSTDV